MGRQIAQPEGKPRQCVTLLLTPAFSKSDRRPVTNTLNRTLVFDSMAVNPYDAPSTNAAQENPVPQGVAIKSIPFRTFVILCACTGFSFGVVLGVVALVASPFGVMDFRLNDRLGRLELQGIAAGLFALLVAPLYLATVSALLSVPGYIPFRLMLKVIRRLRFVVVIPHDAN